MNPLHPVHGAISGTRRIVIGQENGDQLGVGILKLASPHEPRLLMLFASRSSKVTRSSGIRSSLRSLHLL